MINYIQNDELLIGVKTDGAELTTVKDAKTRHEYLWQGDPAVWSGQSPILFPIVGRLKDDTYYLRGKPYTMPKHGFWRKRKAMLLYVGDDTMTFMQTDDADTFELYPYRFRVLVTFTLEGRTLQVTHRVCNDNAEDMLFSIGAHPAFACAIGDKLTFSEPETLCTQMIDRNSLRMPQTKPVLDNAREIEITEHIFDGDALILQGVKSPFVTLNPDKPGQSVRFALHSPYLGIWAKPGAPYVCIEPWWGVNDRDEITADFSGKEGIERLAPHDSREFVWSAEFQ